MNKHKVKQGESIDSIAFEYGFHPEALWEFDKNKQLKSKRKNPNILKEDDEVHVPNIAPFEYTLESGKKHTFNRLGVPSALRIKFTYDNTPRADVPCLFKFKTTTNSQFTYVSTSTDKDGYFAEAIPPNTTYGNIILNPGENEESYPVKIGHINPVDDGFHGIQSMLKNMGYYWGDIDDESGNLTIKAVQEFQKDHDIEPIADDATTIDQETLDAIYKIYTEEE